MSKVDSQLFNAQESATDKAVELCPKCSGGLSIKTSKHGGFIGCDNYPDCDYTRPLAHHQAINSQPIEGSQCPECGHELAVKSGRFGIFIGCSHYPHCDHVENHHQTTSQPVSCPSCQQGFIEHRTNRYGKGFYACNGYPQCKYLINYPPVDEACPDCGFGILVERKRATGLSVECPQKSCHYKRLA